MQLNSFSNFICGFVIENESMKRSNCRESEARDDRATAADREREREQMQKQRGREREKRKIS